MKISRDAINRLSANLIIKAPKLQEKFELFFSCSKEELAGFLPSKETTVEFLPDLQCMDVKVAGIHLRFQFHICYNKNASIVGKVICHRIAPALLQTEKVKDVIGEFTFDSAGFADIEEDKENDKLGFELNAHEIVLHFLCLSLSKPLE